MNRLTPEAVGQLGRPEGTIVFRYTFSAPLMQAPPSPVVILDEQAGGVAARLELSPSLKLRHVRGGEGQGTRTAEVDLRPLLGTQALQIFLLWSSIEVGLTVGDAEKQSELLSGKSRETGGAM